MSVIHVTKENFQSLVLESDKKVLLDFWAVWCGPCKMIAPIVEQIAGERSDVLVGKIDVDSQMELAVQFGIVSIPTLIVMEKGQIVAKSVGYQSREEILKLLNP